MQARKFGEIIVSTALGFGSSAYSGFALMELIGELNKIYFHTATLDCYLGMLFWAWTLLFGIIISFFAYCFIGEV